MNKTILAFSQALENDKLKVPEDELLQEIIDQYRNYTTLNKEEWFVDGLVGLCYFVLQKREIINVVDAYLQQNGDELIPILISKLKPMLVKADGVSSGNLTASGRRKIESSSTKYGLQPRLGFEETFGESKWEEWRLNGGIRGIGLFYMIVRNLKKRDISTNLPWISPGILNIIDDTTVGADNVRLYGILLLQELLRSILKSDENNKYTFSFKDTGLHQIYEPILTGLLYHLPPSSTAEETLRIWEVTYPTLQLLLEVEAFGNTDEYRTKLGQMFSETILQLIIPRIGLEHVALAQWILSYCERIISILERDSTIYLQRILYVLGEYYFRNPFITLNMEVLEQSLHILETLCYQALPESIRNQQYDILACILLTYEKCSTEGALTPNISSKCKKLLKLLESLGCDFQNDIAHLRKRKSLIDLFQQ